MILCVDIFSVLWSQGLKNAKINSQEEGVIRDKGIWFISVDSSDISLVHFGHSDPVFQFMAFNCVLDLVEAWEREDIFGVLDVIGKSFEINLAQSADSTELWSHCITLFAFYALLFNVTECSIDHNDVLKGMEDFLVMLSFNNTTARGDDVVSVLFLVLGDLLQKLGF